MFDMTVRRRGYFGLKDCLKQSRIARLLKAVVNGCQTLRLSSNSWMVKSDSEHVAVEKGGIEVNGWTIL